MQRNKIFSKVVMPLGVAILLAINGFILPQKVSASSNSSYSTSGSYDTPQLHHEQAILADEYIDTPGSPAISYQGVTGWTFKQTVLFPGPDLFHAEPFYSSYDGSDYGVHIMSEHGYTVNAINIELIFRNIIAIISLVTLTKKIVRLSFFYFYAYQNHQRNLIVH